MSTEQKGNKLNEPAYTRSGKLLNKPIFGENGELLTSEGPKGEPLWKKKKKLNEEDGKNNSLNESQSCNIRG